MIDTVLIAGAGPTGLVLALVLTRLGIRVRIIDKALEPGTSSRAIVVHARTLEFYRQLGIADAIVQDSFKFVAANIWAFGKRAGRIQLGDIGKGLSAFPYMLIYPQDEHEKFLIEELKKSGVEVERGTELLSLSQTADEVTAKLRLHDGAEETFKTPYLAGCDGSHSAVRKSFNLEFSGSTYAQMFYVADVEVEGAAANGELHLAIDEADLLAIFPLKGKGHARLIGAVTPEAEKQNEKITWEDVKHEALDRLKLNVKKVNWFSTYNVHRAFTVISSDGPHSALSPGDRMPWLWENDNTFTHFGWQAQVYGEPEAELGETCDRLGIKLKTFKWRRDFAKAGLHENTLYVLRPDMHIGLISAESNSNRISEYFRDCL